MSDTLLPNIVEFIKGIDPFDKMSKNQLDRLSRCIVIEYLSQGECIQMASHRSLFVIRSGAIEQRKSDGVLRARLEPEDIFGFSFLDHQLALDQCYEARAIQNTLLYTLSHEKLNRFLVDFPEYSKDFAAQAQVRIQNALDVVWNPKSKGLFIKNVSEIACNKVTKVEVSYSVQEVATHMRVNNRSSSAIIFNGEELVGIMTDRDMTERVVAQGIALNTSISEVMTPMPVLVQHDDLVLYAASLMMQKGISHLPVMKDGEVMGTLTTANLVQNHRIQAIFLIDKIQNAQTIQELEIFSPERQAIFEALVDGRVPVDIVSKVMSMIMDAYTQRIIEIGIQQHGKPPCEFSWLVAGSHARNEIHMLSDQDSALVFDDSATESDRLYFHHLAMYICNGLAACGYPLCSGKFMAANKAWCQPISRWKSYYKKWASSPEYQYLMNITVFLEIRSVYGNEEFATELQQCLHREVRSNREFLAILTQEATKLSPPLGIFNKLVVEKSGKNASTLDIKKYALNLIIDLARIYSLGTDSIDNNTEGRFTHAYKNKLISRDLYLNIKGAFQFITHYRLMHQLRQLNKGEIPNNHIDPNEFSSFERKHLKDAFRIISDLQDAAKVKHGVR